MLLFHLMLPEIILPNRFVKEFFNKAHACRSFLLQRIVKKFDHAYILDLKRAQNGLLVQRKHVQKKWL